jgi:hypothetical protein
MPANVDITNYAEAWANEILPIAREAHKRLQFTNVHPQQEKARVVAAGKRTKNLSRTRLVTVRGRQMSSGKNCTRPAGVLPTFWKKLCKVFVGRCIRAASLRAAG